MGQVLYRHYTPLFSTKMLRSKLYNAGVACYINYLQELTTYLYYIRYIQTAILGLISLRVVDLVIVKNLQLRAPMISKYNAAFIICYIRNNIIFPSLSNIEKEVVLYNLLSVDLIIPSLYTFCEDIKYLKLYAKAIKILIKLQGLVSL